MKGYPKDCGTLPASHPVYAAGKVFKWPCNYLLEKGGYVFGSVGLYVCLLVCFFVCGQHYSNSYEWIGMKFEGEVVGSTMTNMKFWW